MTRSRLTEGGTRWRFLPRSNRWWLAAVVLMPLLAGCEGSIPDKSDICMADRARLKTLVDSYVDDKPGISHVDLARQGVTEIVPHLSPTARVAFGDGGYWAGLSSPNPRASAIAAAFSADIRGRQSAPLDDMAARFGALTACRQAAAKENRAMGADGRMTASAAANKLEVGRLKYAIELDIAEKGVVAVSIWRGRINDVTAALSAALQAEGVAPAAAPAIAEANAWMRRADAFIAAFRAARADTATFAH